MKKLLINHSTSYGYMLQKISIGLVIVFWVAVGVPVIAENQLPELAKPQQGRTVSGVVKDEIGETLPGVNIVVKGTQKGTISDLDGKFTLPVADGDKILVFSYLGKATLELPIQNVMNVILEDDALTLDEVVISTGYMVQKKADLTGSLAMASSEDLEKNPSANAMKALQGKLPGVFITSDGNPAENVGIQIRGITSFQAAPPLIILDGLPADINLRDINAYDIESIQVLKDAASASIYGSRAASGVIIIETKKGKAGRLQVSYDGSVSFAGLVNKPKMLNTEEYGRALWQANVNDGIDPASIRIYEYDWNRDAKGNPVLNSVKPVEWLNGAQTMRSADTDWFDEITRTGVQQNHQVTVSNGTDKSRSLFSLNYYNNQGTQIETYFKRYSARFNSEYILMDGKVRLGENFTVSYLDYQSGNETYNALIMPSIVPVYTTDGGWGGSAMEMGMDDYWNPYRILKMNKGNNNQFMKALGSAYLDIEPIRNLHIKTQFGIDYSNAYIRHIEHKWEEGGGKFHETNGVTNDQNHTLSYTWTNTINYGFHKGKHALDAVAGTEYIHWGNDGFKAYRDEIVLEDKDYALLSVATGSKSSMYGWADEWALFSYFAKANYVYDSKYLFSATVRYDGSSKFGRNNRWGVFPAFSAGWRISNEGFMESLEFLSDLKLRVSWGKNGNSAIPTNALQNIYIADYMGTAWPLSTSYAIKGNESGALESGYRLTNLGNDDLKWESTDQTNIGLDFGFFNQRLSGSIDYFYKETKGMLYQPDYLGAFGEGGYRWVNGADMRNTGIEVLVSFHSKPYSDFQYSITANFSTFKNKITHLPEEMLSKYGGNGLLDNILGRPLHSHYGYVADGIFKTQEQVDNYAEQAGKGLGRIRYKDLDGDGQINETYDRTFIGVSDPDFTAGLNFSASYKNFDMTLFFQGVFGSQVYDDWKTYSHFWDVTDQRGKNHLREVLNAWSPSNPDSDIPALTTINNNDERRMSTYLLSSGSYLKLRTAEIGYTIPAEISKKAHINRLRMYISGQNLFTIKKWWGDNVFTGPDPESPAFGYLRPLSTTIGVNVTF